jgi:hypothetical protein
VLLTGRTELYRENIQTLINHLNLAFDVVGTVVRRPRVCDDDDVRSRNVFGGLLLQTKA